MSDKRKMKIQILDKAKKKKIIEQIKDIGITKIPELLIRTGKERIRAYSGNLSREEIQELWRTFSIEGIGLYVAKEIASKKSGTKETRLSLDGMHLWEKQVKEKIILLNKEQEELWFRGKDIELTKEQQKKYTFEKCFVVVKSHDNKDIIGTGKTGDKIEILYNYLPKERRRKEKIN